ncbi:MAG: c-type cytochrome [Rhodospirillaceae bacterium]
MAAKASSSPEFSRVGLFAGLGAVVACVAVIGYIAATRPPVDTAANEKNQAQVTMGGTTYQKFCLECHGDRLKGRASWDRAIHMREQAGIPLNADGVTWHLSDQRLFGAIATGDRVKNGKSERIHKDGYAGKLSDAEIWALIAYFKTTWTARQLLAQQESTQRERPGN